MSCPAQSIKYRAPLMMLAMVTMLSVVISLFWNQTRREQLFGHETVYFYSDPGIEPLADYQNVFAVGHNAGSSIRTIGQARSSGANVVEIDVVLLGETLVSAHVPQLSMVGSFVFRGPTLLSVWNEAGDDAVIQLDLKESTPKFRAKVVQFLRDHAGERTVLVATRDVSMLRLLQEDVPDVLRFLSVADASQLALLLADGNVADMLDGVTIRYQLVTHESIAALKDRNLVVLAWTVNDLQMVNTFAAMGVDGFSTNNLAIMEVLNTPDRDSALHMLRSNGSGPRVEDPTQ